MLGHSAMDRCCDVRATYPMMAPWISHEIERRPLRKRVIMTIPADLIDEIRALEEALHRPEVRRSRAAVEALLAREFVEFGASGTQYGRAEMIELLCAEGDEPDDGGLQATDFALTPISSDSVLLTYRTVRKESDGSQRRALRSSIWKQTAGRWQMLFHQGTLTSAGNVDLAESVEG